MGLHEFKLPAADIFFRFRRQRHVQADKVGLPQQIILADIARARTGLKVLVAVTRGVEQRHAKACGPCGHGLRNTPAAHKAQYLTRNTQAQVDRHGPGLFAAAHKSIAVAQFTSHAEHEGKGHISSVISDKTGIVRHPYAVAGGSGNVHMIKADAKAGNDLAGWGHGVNNICGQGHHRRKNAIAATHGFDQLFVRQTAARAHIHITAGLQQFKRFGHHCARNKNSWSTHELNSRIRRNFGQTEA